MSDACCSDQTAQPGSAHDIDLVLETVSDAHAQRSLKVFKAGGVLVSLLNVGDTTKAEAEAKAQTSASGGCPVPDRAGLVELGKLVDAKKLSVAKTFPLEEAGAAPCLSRHQAGSARWC